jgi:hypothetical protein
MKTIDFNAKSENLFHKIKEFELQSESNVLKGKALISGYTQEPIEIGDIFNISGTKYEITEVLEIRNHKGKFSDPSKNVNSFFEVEAKFERLVVLK